MRPSTIFVGVSTLVALAGCVSSNANIRYPLSSSRDLEEAQQALVQFLDLLHSKNYTDAATLFGGDASSLYQWNPDNLNVADLLEKGCAMSLQCLPVDRIFAAQQTSNITFEFTVNLKKNDGSIYLHDPCCGATEENMPTASLLNLFVQKKGDRFVVVSLPPARP